MANLLSRWKEGLAKTSKAAFGQIATLFGATEITPDTWDELEALLIQADVGLTTTNKILDSLEIRINRDGITRSAEMYECLRQELREQLMMPPEIDLSRRLMA